MKNSKKILLGLAIVLMATVASQAATSMYFGDVSGNSILSVNAPATVYVYTTSTDNGTVFEAMLGYDTTAATTYGAATRAGTALNVANVVVNSTLFPDISGNVVRLVKDDVAAREASNTFMGGRPWGKKVVGGLAHGVIPGTAAKLFQFDVTATADGKVVLSTDNASTSYSTAWKMGTSSIFCAANLNVGTAAVAPTLVSAVSRKTHGTVGDFDIPLALAGTGIECRIGGPTKVIMTFSGAVTKDAGFAVTLSSGTLGTTVASGSTLEINLTGATNAAWLAIGVTGLSGGNYNLTVGSLYADVNYSKGVNIADIGLIKGKSGVAIDATTFKYDINCSGGVNIADIGLAQQRSGQNLP